MEHLRNDTRGGVVEGVPAVSAGGSVEGVCVPRGMAQVAKLAFEKVGGDHKVDGDAYVVVGGASIVHVAGTRGARGGCEVEHS